MDTRPKPFLAPRESEIIGCKRCPRLREYCEKVAREKRKAYNNQGYWGKPLPGLGDLRASLWIVGLAPAAHGANRTGRVFTGDRSGEWLFGILYDLGWSNQRESVNQGDGLKLEGVFISCIVRCAPPQNRPTPQEILSCSDYLKTELQELKRHRVILCLGQMAYRQMTRLLNIKRPPHFAHGLEVPLSNGRTLLCSYHPSQQNTFTRVLTWDAWRSIFERARTLTGPGRSIPVSTS